MESNLLSNYVCNINKTYEMESKEFAKGSYGKIYKGKRRKDDLQVAIKVFSNWSSTEEEQKHFIREVNILANLNHPFCLRLVNFSFSPEPIIVTPFMPNGTLDSLLKSNDPTKFTPTEKMCSIYALCSTMDLLHQAGIIHRDLKPANILITDDKDICIADFGSARKVQKNIDLTNFPNGSYLFLSPEAILGDKYDNSTDVFAFGVIYYLYFVYNPFLKCNNELIKAKDLFEYAFANNIIKGNRFIHPPEMNDDQYYIYESCTLKVETFRPTFHELAEKFEKNESLWFKGLDKEKYLHYIARCKKVNKECIEKSKLYKQAHNSNFANSFSPSRSMVIPMANPLHPTGKSVSASYSSSHRYRHIHYD